MVQTKLIDNDSDQSCKRCPLHQTRNTIVWQRGTADKDIDVLFIGEAPGKEEDLQGKPFVGKAGQILNKWIEEAGVINYTIINIVKCRPPNNRKPLQSEIRACFPYFIRQVKEFNPKLIITLGATASYVLANRKEVVTNIGKIFQTIYGNVMIFPHPAYILRGVDVDIPIKELKDVLKDIKNNIKKDIKNSI